MSKIHFDCPNCKSRLTIAKEGAAKGITCPLCASPIIVPSATRMKDNPWVIAGFVISAIVVVAVLFMVVITAGSRPQDKGGPSIPDKAQESIAESPPPVAKKNTDASQGSALENQIYEYIQTQGEAYEKRFSVEKAEALAFIAASKEFKKPIIEISLAFSHIQDPKSGWHFPDDEIDATSILRFKQIGFLERAGTWFYEDEVVNMGTPLPTPDSMKPQAPDTNKALDVVMQITATVSELKKLKIKGRTNLPDGTEMTIILTSRQLVYHIPCPVTVNNRQFESDWFGDRNRPGGRLGDGEYQLEIWTPSVSVLSDSVKTVLGEKGRNMTGKLVVFDPIIGNQVKYEAVLRIQ